MGGVDSGQWKCTCRDQKCEVLLLDPRRRDPPTTSAGLQREVSEHPTSLAWEPVRSFAVSNKVHRGFERQFITKKEEKKTKTLHLAESRIFFKDR